MYFQYGQEETEYLSGKDEKLGAVIAQVGRVNREVDTDLFSAVVHHIVGQQISTKAQATIWQRMRGALGTVDAEHILETGNEQLQLLGISCRKAEYITDFARKIQNGEFDLEGICSVASLYLWAAAGGAVPGLKDYAPKKKAPAKKAAPAGSHTEKTSKV